MLFHLLKYLISSYTFIRRPAGIQIIEGGIGFEYAWNLYMTNNNTLCVIVLTRDAFLATSCTNIIVSLNKLCEYII